MFLIPAVCHIECVTGARLLLLPCLAANGNDVEQVSKRFG